MVHPVEVNEHGADGNMGADEFDSPLRTLYQSRVLRILSAPAAGIDDFLSDVAEQVQRGRTRYYLSAGCHRFSRSPWDLGRGPTSNRLPRTDLSIAESILYHREERSAAFDMEIEAIESWLRRDHGSPSCLIVESFGPPSRGEVGFWQACGTRMAKWPATQPSMIVLRHEASADLTSSSFSIDPQVDEMLLSLFLAGGYAEKSEFECWSMSRGWDRGLVAVVTSARASQYGDLYTYAGLRQWSRARTAYARAGQTLLAELAGMVVSVQHTPLIATAVHVESPSAAFAAYTRRGCAEAAAHRGVISAYGRSLFTSGRKHRWTGIAKRTAGTLWLSAIVADRKRVSPAVASIAVSMAERFGIDADVRALLAYSLGQLLAKDRNPESWAAGARCFDYVHTCLAAKETDDREADGSQIAAAYNGAALAAYRAGNFDGAIAAELAALDALATAGLHDQRWLFEQQVLLLTNLAKVYAQTEERQGLALDNYRQAWQISTAAESLAGMAYVAPGLVRKLLASGEYTEAESVAKELLRQYDATISPSRGVERAVAGSCWALADMKLAEGLIQEAADWYVEAVRRMRSAAPGVIDGIIRNLGRQPDGPPASISALLTDELGAHRAMATDLGALLGLLEDREVE